MSFTQTTAPELYRVSRWIWHPSVLPDSGLLWCDKRKAPTDEFWKPNLDSPANIDAAVAWSRLKPEEFWAECVARTKAHEAAMTDSAQAGVMVACNRWIGYRTPQRAPPQAPCNDFEKVVCGVEELKIE